MNDTDKTINLTDREWKKRLPEDRYRVLRKKGTERAFSGALYRNKQKGDYLCAGCGQKLFSSETKYESGSGWPSFWEPVNPESVHEHDDKSLFMKRTEVVCSRCGGHLGHVFPDGPEPSGMRYCINSLSLEFEDARKGAGQSDE